MPSSRPTRRLLSIRSAPRLEASLDKRPTAAIAATGVGLGLLLSLVVWLLATERRRALQLASGMTLELRESRSSLAGVLMAAAVEGVALFDAVGRQARPLDPEAAEGFSVHAGARPQPPP